MADLDDDIDALMGSVLGRDGTSPAFPPAPVKPVTTARNRSARTAEIETLSTELTAELARNAAPPDPRDVSARFSSLKHMAESPLHYKHHIQYGRDDTLCMRIGRGAHALVLGMPIIQWTGKVRNGKKWDAFEREHADKEILNTSEWNIANGINDAIRSHPVASELLFGDGAVLEEQFEWEFLGKKCTSRPDSRRGSAIITDLKTTRCAEPRRFERDATFRAYHAQMSFYGKAMAQRFGKPPEQTFCVAVESKPPFAITVLELTPAALVEGEKCWRIWFERLLQCERANHWPAYTEAIEPFDVIDGSGELQLTIDGETYDFDEDAA